MRIIFKPSHAEECCKHSGERTALEQDGIQTNKDKNQNQREAVKRHSGVLCCNTELLCIQATSKSADCLILLQNNVNVRVQEHFPTSHQCTDQIAAE